MMTSRTPAALALALIAFGTFGVSCTAILTPRDDVQRCGTAEDCDPTGDNRYVPLCVFDDSNLDLDPSRVDKICVADFRPSVGCNPENFQNPMHPFRMAFDELGDSASYTSCDPMTQLGTLGCPPSGNTCADGLAVNDFGVCDDNDPNTPPAVQITSETLGQDVRDQFCRSFFCDERFVCNTTTNFCQVCDPDEAFGEGGCGEVYTGEGRRCVYESYSGPDDGQCQGSNVTDETVTFGTCQI